jgi:hypothetical protein
MACYDSCDEKVTNDDGHQAQHDTLEGWVVSQLKVRDELEARELLLPERWATDYSMIHHENHRNYGGNRSDQKIQNDIETRGKGKVNCQILVRQR